MSYRLQVRTLGRQSIAPVSESNNDAIDKDQSRAAHRLCRETVCREGVWPVKMVADGPRENTDKPPNNHVLFVLALSGIVSLALESSRGSEPT